MSIIRTAVLVTTAIFGTALTMGVVILCPFAFMRRPRRHGKATGEFIESDDTCNDSTPWDTIASRGLSGAAAARLSYPGSLTLRVVSYVP